MYSLLCKSIKHSVFSHRSCCLSQRHSNPGVDHTSRGRQETEGSPLFISSSLQSAAFHYWHYSVRQLTLRYFQQSEKPCALCPDQVSTPDRSTLFLLNSRRWPPRRLDCCWPHVSTACSRPRLLISDWFRSHAGHSKVTQVFYSFPQQYHSVEGWPS